MSSTPLTPKRSRHALSLGAMIAALGVPACGAAAAEGPPANAPETPTPPATARSDAKTLRLTTACVDPIADGDHRDPSRPFDKHVQFDVRSEDLDGDGVVDTFVKPAWSCGVSCTRSAYVQRGTCGHFVGVFASTDGYGAAANSSHGLRDIIARPQKIEEDGAMHCYQVLMQFDGAAYRQAKRRECECKESGAKCTAWGAP